MCLFAYPGKGKWLCYAIPRIRECGVMMRCIYLLLCYLAELDMLLRSMKVYIWFTRRYVAGFVYIFTLDKSSR